MFLWAWVDRLGRFVVDVGPSAAALVALAALAQVATRQPARRLRQTRMAVFGLLALVPLDVLFPWPRLDLLAVVRGLVPAGSDVDAWPGAFGRWLATAYAAGLGFGLARLLLGYAGLAWLARHSAEPSDATRALYDALPYAGRGPRPALRVSRRVRHPVVVGFPRAAVLIPPTLDLPEPGKEGRDRLRLGLLHELAHAEGYDPAATFAGQLALALWYVFPPLWWLLARMRLDQEFLADRRAALAFGPAGDYASALLDLATTPGGTPLVPAAVAAAAPAGAGGDAGLGGSPLFQRVLMLLRCPFVVEPWPPSGWAWVPPCLAVALTVGVSRLAVQPAPAAQASVPAPKEFFSVSRLEIPGTAAGPHGRAPALELPIRLPDHFRLKARVFGDLQTLAQMRVAGVRLECPLTSSDSNASAAPAGWHVVRLERNADGVRLWLDGLVADPHPLHTPLTSWLTVEPPPDRTCLFRDLTLTW